MKSSMNGFFIGACVFSLVVILIVCMPQWTSSARSPTEEEAFETSKADTFNIAIANNGSRNIERISLVVNGVLLVDLLHLNSGERKSMTQPFSPTTSKSTTLKVVIYYADSTDIALEYKYDVYGFGKRQLQLAINEKGELAFR